MDAQLLKQYEEDGKAFFDKIIAGIKFVQANETAQLVEGAIPEVKALFERLAGFVPLVGEVEGIADTLVAVYTFAEAFGIKGMDANEMALHEAERGMSND